MLEGQTTRREVQTVQTNFDRAEAMTEINVVYGKIFVPAELAIKIFEWARWVRVSKGLDSRGRCASAEGRYVSTYPDFDSSAYVAQPDMRVVLAVERTVCNPMFPAKPREIIRRQFVVRAEPKDIARALGIHGHSYGDELKRSIVMIKNRLTTH
jgi:hypothetical protein